MTGFPAAPTAFGCWKGFSTRITRRLGAWIATVGEIAAHHAASSTRALQRALRPPRQHRATSLRKQNADANLHRSQAGDPLAHGLVAAQNRHAAEAGAAVLARGGNAMDAAVVTALVFSMVEPWLSGIGGGGFLLHADGVTGADRYARFQRDRTPVGLDTSELSALRKQGG